MPHLAALDIDRVRRFICGNTTCGARTFVEHVDGLTRRRLRSTDGLRQTLTSIGLALAGRSGPAVGVVEQDRIVCIGE
ncbi:hypothetical protein ADL15_39635 [Actinoplanes awajinensis subsp. mycoplanecinus]|uniref:Uncharacterized protein n=1 Tax=Actinoplanes awajinensis subsp. mycoplanecinus TaxID=135947 RepID=A0A124G8G7_9ACTN|nr:hypothetical protein ADL15_39635 [Actinoplanes awajinensis subsp. mycoplanecinus]